MSRQIDRIFLIVLSAVLYYLAVGDLTVLIPVILTVILCALNMFFKNPVFQSLTFIGFLVLCVPFPLFFIFLPVFLYDTALTVFRWLILLSPAILFFIWNRLPFSIFILSCCFFVLSLLMAKKQSFIELLTDDYNTFRKTSQNLALLQEEKSKSILENQDYEIRNATLKERNRISKEIHDHVGHVLSRSLLQIGALMTLEKDPAMLEGLASLKSSISEGMDSIRDSIHNMHDESIDLKTSLEELIHDFTFCPVDFDYDVPFAPKLELKYCFIAIVKEGLTNIIKHSDATKAAVRLCERETEYFLEIADNGTISPETTLQLIKAQARNEYSDGMGLQSMYDRVKSFHGSFSIQTEQGFCLSITIPKEDFKNEITAD